MNLARVFQILGLLLMILAGAQLLPLLWCLAPDARGLAPSFLAGASATALLGATLRRFGSSEGELYRREGVLIVVGAWVLASITGAIPYLVSGAIASPVDALFESASGFTTTGASILTDIESVGRPLLFWRSFTQWLGGIGIIVLFVALLSELGPGARFLFKLEVPGPKGEVLHARVQETASALSRVYLAMTLIQVMLLLLLGLDLYDALAHTFSTVSTGGFSPYNDSMGHFSTGAQLVVLVFMVTAGINFSIIFAVLRDRALRPLRDLELRCYLVLIAAASLAIIMDRFAPGDSEPSHPLDTAFQVVSIVTTTGYATTDFDAWPDFSRAVLVALMVAGGCAGSTAGGAKLIRLIIGWKAAMREVRLTFSPSSVIAVVVDRRAVPEDSVRSVVGLILLWLLAWGVGALLLAVGETDILTAATASIANLSNIGPGLGAVGSTQNYAFFAPWQKLVMVALMWLGRLEFFVLLALFQRRFWNR